jgi:hypothetical protein
VPDKKLALANGGQKALLSAKSGSCLGKLRRPKADRGGHSRTQPSCSGHLFVKTAKRIGGVPWTRADKMETKALAELAGIAEENVSNHPLEVVSSR